MNVTSVLSKGYLEPARNVSESGSAGKSSDAASVSLAAQERQILAQERMLKTMSGSGTQVSTTYRYTVGPDGRRYITGAEVTIRGDEDVVDRVGGGVKRAVFSPVSDETKPEEEEKNASPGNGKADGETAAKIGEDSEDEAVRELKQIEREVVTHESAHQAAGGRFAGAVSYTYTRGPDGHSYIAGGEVPIRVPPSDDPEQTVRDMEQVQRAALAPASPSGQDRAVAAQAAAAAAQARQEIAASGTRKTSEYPAQNTSGTEGAFKTGAASALAELLRDRVQSGSELKRTETARANELDDLRGAYARAASPLGLWALGRGFETPAPKEEGKEEESEFPFEIAA
jgi:hypothetical protein